MVRTSAEVLNVETRVLTILTCARGTRRCAEGARQKLFLSMGIAVLGEVCCEWAVSWCVVLSFVGECVMRTTCAATLVTAAEKVETTRKFDLFSARCMRD